MKEIDIPLLISVIILISIGIIMVFSTSAVSEGNFYLKRVLLWVGFGLFAMFAFAYLRFKALRLVGISLFILSVILLVLVLLFGVKTHGARRWLSLGIFSFQPAELAKLSLIVFLSYFISRNQNQLKDFRRGVLPMVGIVGVTIGLILIEPDFGMSLLVAGICGVLFFVGGVRLLHLIYLALPMSFGVMLLIIRKGYPLERIKVFFNPWEHSATGGYQIIQSFLALGSGGLFGKGLGRGLQKLGYLPQAYTDFIFAIIGEELGFVGTAVVVLLFIFFVCKGIKIAMRAPDLFSYLLALGVTIMISFQAVFHMGVVTKFLPTTGTTLPFISFGGSSLLVNMMGVGILLNISRQAKLRKPVRHRG